MTKENSIKCPHCGGSIDVNEVLYHQLEEKIKISYDKQSAKEKQELKARIDEIQAKEDLLKRQQEKLDTTIELQVKTKLKAEATKLEKTIREKVSEEKSEELEALQKELGNKSEQLKELNRTKAENERLKRESSEQAEKIALEKEKEFSLKLIDEKKRIKQQAIEENTLKIRELQLQLEEQRKLAEEAVRKAEQSSMQRQGEVQELELENILRELHKYDEIAEVKKGQRGADVLQRVMTPQGVECGKIYYESKRTKNFDNNWLQKLRDDNLNVKADVLVLVTETMPEGQEKFFFIDGIWICSLWEVKGLSLVLRYGLMQVHSVSITQQGKETKMEMLYNYLTSQEFTGQFGAIIEGFRSLQLNYADEKLRMQKIWKEREKQLEKILSNTVGFYGSIKGIAGASIPEIKILEDRSPVYPTISND